MSNIHTHIKNEHPELSVPESVQPTESSDGDDYGPSQMSSESDTEYESAKKPQQSMSLALLLLFELLSGHCVTKTFP